MKTLMLLRHGKSSWTDGAVSDHDRPLNERGHRDAPRMGALLAQLEAVPDVILSSSAVRARTTAEAVAEECGCAQPVRVMKELYLASPADIVDVLQLLGDSEDQRAMVVGHNPGLERLSEMLSHREERFPTATLSAVDLPIESWSELALETAGKLVGIWRPKELRSTR